MKKNTIKICGTAGSGKSILQYFLIKEMRNKGLIVKFVPSDDFKTERDLYQYVESFLFEGKIDLSTFEVSVETVQLNRTASE